MPAKTIVPGVHQVLSGIVNAFLIETPVGLVLIDAGMPGSEKRILAAMQELGHEPQALKHIVCTHAHPDHIGSLAALQQATGAQTWIHEIDAPIAETARFRPVHPAPGIGAHLFFYVVRVVMGIMMLFRPVLPARVDHRVADGELLPFEGMKAVHLPGHCAGQIAILWPGRRILFVADSCANLRGLTPMRMNEDLGLALESMKRLLELDFDIALFGHGDAILSGARNQFQKAFGQSVGR